MLGAVIGDGPVAQRSDETLDLDRHPSRREPWSSMPTQSCGRPPGCRRSRAGTTWPVARSSGEGAHRRVQLPNVVRDVPAGSEASLRRGDARRHHRPHPPALWRFSQRGLRRPGAWCPHVRSHNSRLRRFVPPSSSERDAVLSMPASCAGTGGGTAAWAASRAALQEARLETRPLVFCSLVPSTSHRACLQPAYLPQA